MEALFRGTIYHRWYLAAQQQMPRVVHVCRHDAEAIALTPAAAEEIQIRSARTWLFGLPSGCMVACLELSFLDRKTDQARPLPEIFGVVDAGRSELMVGGRGILEACSGSGDSGLGELSLGGDMHHIWCLKPGVIASSMTLDQQLLMQMVSRRAAPSRSSMLSAIFPKEPNRFADCAAAITPGATVLAGQAHAVEVAMVICAVQALGALSLLRQTQRSAFAALADLRSPAPNIPTKLVLQSHRLKTLEVDLSFGVEAYLEQRLLVPSLPVEQLHNALVDSLALPRSAEITATMLKRLTSALEAEASALSVEAAAREEDRRRAGAIAAAGAESRAAARRLAAATAAGVAGLVALPLTFLGANVSEVDSRQSIFDRAYWLYYLIIASIILSTALMARLYVKYEDRKAEKVAAAAEAREDQRDDGPLVVDHPATRDAHP